MGAIVIVGKQRIYGLRDLRLRSQVLFLGPFVRIDAKYIFEIMGELQIGVGNRFEVLLLESDFGTSVNYCVMFGPLSLKLGKRKCRLAGIPDLASIPPRLLVFQVVLRGEFQYLLIYAQLSTFSMEPVTEHCQVQLEDLDGRVESERRIVEADVDTRGKSFIEVANTISGQK